MQQGQSADARIDLEKMIGPLSVAERKFLPAEFFAQGDVELLREGIRVSIIGSRDASNDGIRDARHISRALSHEGAVIVSGLAVGIDSAAHREAIANNGMTIAVLGTALDVAYPPENAELLEEIKEDHLAVSQFASGDPVSRQNFPKRNRTMALISHATIIIEAKQNSGTRHQGWAALRIGRPLFLMPRVAEDPAITWAEEMLRHGAKKLNVNEISDVYQALEQLAT
ncbi:DNA-processing protein DprA [Hoeflea sp. TYP-13]|uniref:DNA-processing protein DprA n=1 Tax=Hoeflea sp. TYP-13 TaxID=3230023 RepID=UPI0034C64808